MSKNHPHDNIYSILGKLDALKPTPAEERFALVKEIRESVEAKGSVLEGVDAVEAKLARQFAESDFSKMSAAIQKTGKSKASADAITAAAGREKLGQKEMTRRSVAGRKDESYNPDKAVKQCAKDYMEMNGIASVHDLEAEDIESIGGDCQMNYQDVCEILGCNLPDSLGPVKSWDTDEHGNKFDLEEGVCNECGMMEGSCEHTMREGEFAGRSAKYGVCVVGHNGGKPVKMFDTEAEAEAYAKKGIRIDGKLLQGSVRTIVGEGEPTHKGGEKVATKLGTLHKSKATVDTEKELSRGDVPDLDADDSEPAVAKGRGRPKMDIKDRSQAKMPWGGKPPKDTYKHQKGSFVHKIAESRIVDESGETMEHILNRFRHEVRNFEQGGDLDDNLYDALFDYYLESGEIPYGVAKARTGDPYEWVAQNLESHLRGGGIVGGNPDEDYGMEREGIEGRMPPVDNIPGKEDLLRGKGRSYYEEEVTMEDELNELARLAGLKTTDEGNAFTGKLKATAKGDKFDLDGKEYTDTSTLDEEPEMEGNAFGKAVADAKADGIQPGEKVRVGDKEYPVKEAQDLLQMMKIAGLDATVLEEAIEKATKKDLDDMEAQDREHEFGTVPDETDSELEEDTTFDECGDAHPEGDFNINTSMSGHGDKSVTVTATGDHAAELLQMLRIAGLGGGAKAQELEPHAQMHQEPIGIEIVDAPEEVEEEYGDAHVDTPSTAPVNAPKPEYKSMRASTMGPGEGDPGEKTMNPDRPTHNNGDNALATPPTRAQKTLISVSALESKFAAEYESIKKVS